MNRGEKFSPGGSISDTALKEVLSKLEQYRPKVVGLAFYRDFDNTALLNNFKKAKNLIAICEAKNHENPSGIKPPSANAVPPERVGFSNIIEDDSLISRGVLRRYLLEMPQPDQQDLCQSRQAFSLLIARQYIDLGKTAIVNYNKAENNEDRILLGNKTINRINSYQYGGYQGVDASGFQLMLNYRQSESNDNKKKSSLRQAFSHYKVEDVRMGKFDRSQFENKIVLIGLTATSQSKDRVLTPYGEEVSGVTIHAQMVSQLLSTALNNRRSIWVLPQWVEFLWIWFWSILGGILVYYRRRTSYIVLLGGGCLAVIYLTSLIAMITSSVWILIFPPMLSFIASGYAVSRNQCIK